MREPSKHARRSVNGNRRAFLKAAGAFGTSLGVAGCTEEGGNGGGGGNGTTTSQQSGSSGDFSDVTFEFWDILNTQSPSAKQFMEDTISEFEEETGATVQVNFTGFGEVAGAKWQNNFSRGIYPPVLTFPPIGGGAFMEDSSQSTSYFKPVSEYRDKLDQEALSNIEWILEGSRKANAWKKKLGMDNVLHSVPLNSAPQNPFAVRIDHFEEAGLDPESDFPPKGPDHLLEVAQTLQKDGPGDVGFQVFGHEFDYYIYLNPRAGSENIDIGGNLDQETYERVSYGAEPYRQAIKENIEFHTKHDMGVPQTPNLNTESAYGLFANGTISMAMFEAGDVPNIRDQAPDLWESGNFRFGPFWEAEDGVYPGGHTTTEAALTVPPDGTDEKEWERKQEAGIALINKMLSKDWQSKTLNLQGRIPMREDVHESVIENTPNEENTHWAQTFINFGRNMPRVNTSHPEYLSVSGGVLGTRVQQGLRGEKSPKQVADEATREGNNLLKEYWSDRGVSI